MMAEYEYIFSNTLKNKLIDKVKGGVKTWIYDDELHISIRMTECDVQFEYIIPNISDRILNSFTTDYAVYQVMQEYKKYLNEKIREKFFK